jgi:hypothetical protein
MVATDGAYEAVCEALWREVQQNAQAEGDAGAELIVEYSFLFDDKLTIWLFKGTGELLGSMTVSTRPATRRESKAKSNDRMFEAAECSSARENSTRSPSTVGETITATLETMGVRGRNAMMRQAERQSAEDAVQEDASLRHGREVEADTAQGRLEAINRDQEVLGAFYQLLLAPVEAHLAGATEVLIIPHKELFRVPWPHSSTAKQGST